MNGVVTGQSAAPERFPDPLVTGSLYCSRGLDEIQLRFMVPLRRDLRMIGTECSPYLWSVRYAKGGEHLKVRVHGIPEIESVVRDLLRRRADEFLTEIGPALEGIERLAAWSAPPIDEEDRSTEPPPDRSFLFTNYRRSHVSLGAEPLLGSDQYCAAITLALARGCDLVVDALASQGAVLTYGHRQRLLLKALLSGIAALRFPLEKAEEYLAYHRDWLIRFPLLQKGGSEKEAENGIARLEERAMQSSPTIEVLRSTVEQWWTGDGIHASVYPEGISWCHAVANFHYLVSQFRNDPAYHVDPFAASDPTFNPLFKVFHGLANQLGLKAREEAYAHHLLLQAATQTPSRWHRISLTPD